MTPWVHDWVRRGGSDGSETSLDCTAPAEHDGRLVELVDTLQDPDLQLVDGGTDDAWLDLSALRAAIDDRLRLLAALGERRVGEVPPIAVPRRP